MNERVVGWCREQGLEVTRARAYRKNDQAWVEQKNGAIVRRLVGYGRFEGLESVRAMKRRMRGATASELVSRIQANADQETLNTLAIVGVLQGICLRSTESKYVVRCERYMS